MLFPPNILAHIKDPVSGAWYKFNDEVVKKLEGTKLKLGIEEEEEGIFLLLNNMVFC